MTYIVGSNIKSINYTVVQEPIPPTSDIFNVQNIIELTKNQYYVEMADNPPKKAVPMVAYPTLNTFAKASEYCSAIYTMMNSARSLTGDPEQEVVWFAPSWVIYPPSDTFHISDVSDPDSVYGRLVQDYSFYKLFLKNAALMRYLDFMLSTKSTMAFSNGAAAIPVISKVEHPLI